ncbi:unnamed protein product [Rangifer tarandus platyrhynchus]|uniref:Uncharacterized protein n=2 Tax=Rangifer tarandus platyrhynchus TaxID=3082113 RepID=A0ABN8Y3Y9_RANTA|nr:unnamed protein product [Rangifer tarandus platyrhynchus]CAI9695659.1 unnamed protein product [Rangifer tarandus platyrhynchus]
MFSWRGAFLATEEGVYNLINKKGPPATAWLNSESQPSARIPGSTPTLRGRVAPSRPRGPGISSGTPQPAPRPRLPYLTPVRLERRSLRPPARLPCHWLPLLPVSFAGPVRSQGQVLPEKPQSRRLGRRAGGLWSGARTGIGMPPRQGVPVSRQARAAANLAAGSGGPAAAM